MPVREWLLNKLLCIPNASTLLLLLYCARCVCAAIVPVVYIIYHNLWTSITPKTEIDASGEYTGNTGIVQAVSRQDHTSDLKRERGLSKHIGGWWKGALMAQGATGGM